MHGPIYATPAPRLSRQSGEEKNANVATLLRLDRLSEASTCSTAGVNFSTYDKVKGSLSRARVPWHQLHQPNNEREGDDIRAVNYASELNSVPQHHSGDALFEHNPDMHT